VPQVRRRIRRGAAVTLSRLKPQPDSPSPGLHAIAWLHIAGRPAIRLMPGDVVLLPTGITRALASAPDADIVPFDHLAAEQALAAGDELHLGAGIPQTRILCASYHQDPAVTLPLLTLLPDMLHIPRGVPHTHPALTGPSPSWPPPSVSRAPRSPAASRRGGSHSGRLPDPEIACPPHTRQRDRLR